MENEGLTNLTALPLVTDFVRERGRQYPEVASAVIDTLVTMQASDIPEIRKAAGVLIMNMELYSRSKNSFAPRGKGVDLSIGFQDAYASNMAHVTSKSKRPPDF